MTIQVHILNATGKLTELLTLIHTAFSQSLERVAALLPLNNVDVVIHPGTAVIPETGMTGYCPSPDVLYLQIDPSNPNLLQDFNTEFRATLGHELHHCLRHSGPGYGDTFEEVLVTEGLACHFEAELRDGKPPFYARSLDPVALIAMAERARPSFKSRSYDHMAWFFGSESERIPRHTGYSLGFHIVAPYIRESGKPASQLWNARTEVFGTEP